MKKVWKNLKRQGLMEVVVRVLSRDGLNGLTMDSIAREAGVAKGTLYSYFRNKQDLVKEAIDATVVPMVEDLTSILKGSGSAVARLRQMTFRHLTYFDENRNFFRIFIHDRMAAQQRLKRYRSCLYTDFLKATAATLEDGIQAGEFRPVDSLKLAAMLVEADIAVINQRLLSDQPGPVEPDATLISDVFLRGIQRVQ